MKKSIIKKITAIATCAAMVVPTFTIQNISASAEEIDFPEYEDIIEGDYISEMGQAITYWANSLVNNSTFNAPCTSSTWYNNVSDVELLSRILYGENASHYYDRIGVAWVIINRKNDTSGDFANLNTYRAVVTQNNAFTALNSSLAKQQQNSGDSNWYNAVWLACAMLYTSSESDYISLFGKPLGITSHKFYRGSSFMVNNDYIRDTNGYLEFYFDSAWHHVYNVIIVGESLYGSYYCTTKSQILSYYSYDKNIFFTY